MKAIIKFFKDLFSPSIEVKPLPEVNIPTTRPSTSNYKVAIIVGHSSDDKGAARWDKKISEWDYNSHVAEIVAQMDTGKQCKVFYRTATGITGVAARAAQFKPDLSIELHLNAASGVAVGCEVLCLKGDSKSGLIGAKFAQAFTSKFNRKLRGDKGIKWIASGDRGYTSLKAQEEIPCSILVEPFFIDNKDEWVNVEEYTDFLAEFIKSI